MEERLKKLRAWIYLRAPTARWAEVGYNEKAVLAFSEEHLKLVAFTIIVSAGRAEGAEKALALASELNAIGYSEAELAGAKRQFDLILKSITGLDSN